MGSISQIIVMALATVIYLPFFLAYEAQQNKESAEA
jgi:PTS system cellobiose-specific IIC component